ncbi:MAG: hypothetical protein ACTSYX_02195 [Candidatus Thorarchaeota archaeon]
MSEKDKADRFRRVAEKRVNRAIKAIHLVGQCSNKRVYSYTEDQVRDMFNAIENELRLAKQLYASRSIQKGFRFGEKSVRT